MRPLHCYCTHVSSRLKACWGSTVVLYIFFIASLNLALGYGFVPFVRWLNARAERLQRLKYEDPDWTLRGVDPDLRRSERTAGA